MSVETVVSGAGASPAPSSGAASSAIDEEQLRTRIAPVVRALVREELERYLRTAAD
jgi:hypothetical protein